MQSNNTDKDTLCDMVHYKTNKHFKFIQNSL